MTLRPGALLASDLDGTLIPPGDSPSHQGALTRFARLVEQARPGLALAYVTGRDLGMALAGVERWTLPIPDFMACDVGTSIYHKGTDGFVVDDRYAERMRDAFGGIAGADVLGVLDDLPQVRPQPAAVQGMHKASFFFPWDEWSLAEPAVARRLAESGVKADLVVSRDLVTGDGLLDVVPAGGGKGRAVTYLADLLELSLDRVVFAGDSGNDRAALLSGARSVLVGNAPAHVRADLREEARARRLDDRVYLAEGEGAEGVVEGLVHWGIVPG